MKKLKHICLLSLTALIAWGCGTDSAPKVEEPTSQMQFVWNAMNYWYYWQDEVVDLADNRFDGQQEFYEYLNNRSDAKILFETLLHPDDDFSFFIEDYEVYQQNQQGISVSFGYEYGLVRVSQNSDGIIGYVQYVLPGYPAENAGLVRGDIFTRVDGTQLTVNNYRELLFDKTNYELTLATYANGNISETGNTANLNAVEVNENPIFIDSVYTEGSTKIGYLMYNAFQRNSHEDLNTVFGTFQSEGIDELVVDLRYNGGGAGITSQTLAGMISGLDSSNDFATYSYNPKRAPQFNRTVSIQDEVPVGDNGETIPMNQLSLDRVYFLTGFGTASASELLINALRPYMEVILVGEQTVGKDEGSYTLYDAPAPYFDEEEANPNHKNAIQPIALKLVNRDGQAYPDGFLPDYDINELDYLEDLPPLGSTSDPLLARAIELITGQPPAKATRAEPFAAPFRQPVADSRDLEPYGKRLYIEPPQKK